MSDHAVIQSRRAGIQQLARGTGLALWGMTAGAGTCLLVPGAAVGIAYLEHRNNGDSKWAALRRSVPSGIGEFAELVGADGAIAEMGRGLRTLLRKETQPQAFRKA